MWRKAMLAALLGVSLLSGCGGEDADLTVYSGRNEELVEDLFDRFEDDSGLVVEVRYGDSAELAATIHEEGGKSPADVFFAQDAGSLGSVEELLAPIPAGELRRVPEKYRDPKGRWVGTSGRVRVVAFNTETVDEGDLPDSIWEYADERWRGRIGVAPTNASFQAMVTAMRLAEGDERTREWLERLAALEPKTYENNIATIEAVASGEVAIGFVNHYYLYGLLSEDPDAPVRNHFLGAGDPGALVNVAGAGVLASSDTPQLGRRLVEFLLSSTGQEYFAAETAEYPLAAGVQPEEPDLPPLGELHGPDIGLGDLGGELERTLELLRTAGLTS